MKTDIFLSGNSRDRTCGLPVNGRTLCQLSYEPIYFFSGNSRDRTCGLPVNGRTLCQLSYEPIYFFCRALKLPIWFSVSGPSDCLHDPCVFTDSNRFDSVTGYCFTIVLCCEGHSLCRTLFDSMVISHVQRYCCKCPCIVFRPVDWIRTNNNFVPNDLICC